MPTDLEIFQNLLAGRCCISTVIHIWLHISIFLEGGEQKWTLLVRFAIIVYKLKMLDFKHLFCCRFLAGLSLNYFKESY